MDLKLPKLSGLEVLRWLKSRPGLRRIPTIILTSSRETADVNAAYDLGANAYLLKAVHFNDLVETLGLFRSFWLELNRSPVASGADESDR
jgi:CheY-like chemotaxis protein